MRVPGVVERSEGTLDLSPEHSRGYSSELSPTFHLKQLEQRHPFRNGILSSIDLLYIQSGFPSGNRNINAKTPRISKISGNAAIEALLFLRHRIRVAFTTSFSRSFERSKSLRD